MKAELESRQRRKADRFTKWVDDPCGFIEMELYETLWSIQKRILEALVEHRQVAVPSCHDAGKSFIASRAAAWWISTHPLGEAFVVTLAPTNHQVKAILWRELNRAHKSGRLPGRMLTTEWKMLDGELIGFGRSPKDTDPTSIQGIHAKYVLVILDEATGIAKPLWDAVSSLCANEYSRILAIGNPDDPSCEFADVCKPGSGWQVIPISAFDTPNLTDEPVPDFLRPLLVSRTWVEERKRKWGETSPVYQSKVLGQFPKQASDALISAADIKRACLLDYHPSDMDDDELGVDVARFGDDDTVMYHRKGNRARQVAKFNGRDLMKVCGEIVRLCRELPIRRVKVDDCGLGGGVTDRLMELQGTYGPDGYPIMRAEVVAVNVGSAPELDEEGVHFFNLRAELHWMLRDRFMTGMIDLDPDDLDVQAQAGDIKYSLTSKGQIKVETKDEMKKRGRPSPNDLDAIILAFAPGDTALNLWTKIGQQA